MTRSIGILGSTGSVGRQTLDVVAKHGPANFMVDFLCAGTNAALLAEQARRFNARCVAIADEAQCGPLRDLLADRPEIIVLAGRQALIEAAQRPVDLVMAAIVGVAGLEPTMAAINQGRSVAFASKECLVAAGGLMMDAVKKSGAAFLPVDSEHNAIFQVMQGQDKRAIRRVVLTASGGPFRTWGVDAMSKATPEQAVAHPKWSMGAKISVDSATLMNKALEVIEAHHLFGLPSSQIDVLVHPQSVVHGMVEYVDGSLLAQMGPADMRTPISVCLGWPARLETAGGYLDFAALAQLEFEAPDTKRFPALHLVRAVLSGGPDAAIAFNAANEVAVAAFLARQIAFPDILDIVARILDDRRICAITSLDDVIAYDAEIRIRARQSIKIAA